MAKITDGIFREWHDTETINASEYVRERELLRVANNDNDERISSVEESIVGFQLGNAQLQKITSDTGGVTLTTTSVYDSILNIIKSAGTGLRTFYAAGGSQDLPPTNLAIRGIAHFTTDKIGWVYATDYKNNVFTNYYDSGWKGWVQLVSSSWTPASALNTMNTAGFYTVTNGTINAPTGNEGQLHVLSTSSPNAAVTQIFYDLETGMIYTRRKNNTVWEAWNRLVTSNDTQTELWSGEKRMDGSTTVTPIKKLSQCRNGWILVWSDFNTDTMTAGDFSIGYSYIPKGTPFKQGQSQLFNVPHFLSSTTSVNVIKKLAIYDDRFLGHADNVQSATGTSSVVLRSVLEW